MAPDALAELLALGQTTVALGRASLHFVDHRWTDPHDWLSATGLVTWEPAGEGRWEVVISRLGWLVLLRRVEWDMRAAGLIPPEEELVDG
ncbi:MAG TPA: hypothetical protein VMV33_17315 [Rhodocyclaceae bacterium]|nr:hypothetical protein [Rhodocyclaceae bacterium]